MVSSTPGRRRLGRFPIPTLHELPEDIRARINSVEEKLGFVPNVFWTLAHRPDEFRAFFAFFDALMQGDSGVTKAEREMIVVVTAALDASVYCLAHHGAILRLRTRNAALADRISVNYRRADVAPRQRAMLDFAVKVASESHAIEDADFERLAEHGFSDEDIWDIGAITAFFSYGSRMANLIAMQPNDEFFALGRPDAQGLLEGSSSTTDGGDDEPGQAAPAPTTGDRRSAGEARLRRITERHDVGVS